MCSDCHGFLGNLSLTELNNISDFGSDHSEFRATLMPGRGERDDPRAWRRVSLDDANIRHQTGLVFPHDLHLAADGVEGPRGREVLDCDDCHRADASGNRFELKYNNTGVFLRCTFDTQRSLILYSCRLTGVHIRRPSPDTIQGKR